MYIDVVMPALNTEATIRPLIDAFVNHPAIGRIYVCVDWLTTDDTMQIARDDAVIIKHNSSMIGKGQTVMAGLDSVDTEYVVFCDSDITGLTGDHISLLIAESFLDDNVMTLGIPDIPANFPRERKWAWPWVTGQRCVPTRVIRPLKLHGYLMETQINLACQHAKTSVRKEWLHGVVSPYDMTWNRVNHGDKDFIWGKERGIL